MYDEYAQHLINLIPDLPDLDKDQCRRSLSLVYYFIVQSRLSIEFDTRSSEDIAIAIRLLRRMADTLESVAVFESSFGNIIDRNVEDACAFVAAESLALVADYYGATSTESPSDLILDERIYSSIEAALLYMIGGYDVNAFTIANGLEKPALEDELSSDAKVIRNHNSEILLLRVLSLCEGDVIQDREGSTMDVVEVSGELHLGYETIIDEIRAASYKKMAEAVEIYLDWLGGFNDTGLNLARDNLEELRDRVISQEYRSYSEFADLFHLIHIMLAAIERTSHRSLINNVPDPIEADERFIREFQDYLRVRARGDNLSRGRPFLWPSSQRYLDECLPGPSKDAVVSMPTGSGKSFIGELAIVNALANGWVLYLTPTNALAHQVRRDLQRALRPFKDVGSIRAFVGDREYTTLEGERIAHPEDHFVVVMTPEKCSLALRINPEIFSNCSLCIFDECHLINEPDRGITADILLAQISIVSPSARFLLMSAMVGNPRDLSSWLESIHPGESVPIQIAWRPSRTLRGLLVVNREELDANFSAAKSILEEMPSHRVNKKFPTPLALIAGLSGPWTPEGSQDYRISNVGVDFEGIANRDSTIPIFQSWKNTASRLLSVAFAKSKIPVICFVLSSKHHAFSLASNVDDDIWEESPPSQFPNLIEAFLHLSDEELGVKTKLHELFKRGITVHTSALIAPEHAASEWMFLNGYCPLMFATGTLAQGLNLPALAVVIAGTSLGDPRRTVNRDSEISRVDTLILNGFGRAGRPGFSNQGIGVLVSDRPYRASVTHDLDPTLALEQYPVLGKSDAAFEISSPVESFLDYIMAGEIDVESALPSELKLTSLLAEYDTDEHNSGQVLSSTFAAYRKRDVFTQSVSQQARQRITNVKSAFIEQSGIPGWLNNAAMRAGVDFFRAWRIWAAYDDFGFINGSSGISDLSVMDWFDIFIEVMMRLPPRRIIDYLPGESIARVTVLTRMRDRIINQRDLDQVPWDQPEDWRLLWTELNSLLKLYMSGSPYAVIAREYLGLGEGEISNRRSSGSHPIPSVLGFIRNIVDRLSIDAGCFLALHEWLVADGSFERSIVPDELRGLPLCIRNGCDSLGTLSWFRFGFRQRIVAHTLNANYPLPVEIDDDVGRLNWIKNSRRNWLAQESEHDEVPLLRSTRVVIEANQ